MSARLPTALRERIATLLRAKELPADIAKQCKVSVGCVYNIAKAKKIAYRRTTRGEKRTAYLEQIARERASPAVQEGPNWRAQAAALRWNSGLGGSGWRS